MTSLGCKKDKNNYQINYLTVTSIHTTIFGIMLETPSQNMYIYLLPTWYTLSTHSYLAISGKKRYTDLGQNLETQTLLLTATTTAKRNSDQQRYISRTFNFQ